MKWGTVPTITTNTEYTSVQDGRIYCSFHTLYHAIIRPCFCN